MQSHCTLFEFHILFLALFLSICVLVSRWDREVENKPNTRKAIVNTSNLLMFHFRQNDGRHWASFGFVLRTCRSPDQHYKGKRYTHAAQRSDGTLGDNVHRADALHRPGSLVQVTLNRPNRIRYHSPLTEARFYFMVLNLSAFPLLFNVPHYAVSYGGCDTFPPFFNQSSVPGNHIRLIFTRRI